MLAGSATIEYGSRFMFVTLPLMGERPDFVEPPEGSDDEGKKKDKDGKDKGAKDVVLKA